MGTKYIPVTENVLKSVWKEDPKMQRAVRRQAATQARSSVPCLEAATAVGAWP